MAKLTLSSILKSKRGATYPDPAVPGLRYRARTGGVYAELRHKVGPGRWKAVPLGRLPTEVEFDALMEARRQARWQQRPDDGSASAGGLDIHERLELLLGEARRAAVAAKAKLKAGGEPSQAKQTLGAVIDDYLAHMEGRSRPRTQTERRRHLLRHWAAFHHRPAVSLTRAEIASHLLMMKPVAANRSRATLRAMFTWADGIGRVEAVPTFPSKVGAERSRERVLSVDELHAIWAATAGGGDHDVIVRLLMLTGQRREEVGGCDGPSWIWSERCGRCRAPGQRTGGPTRCRSAGRRSRF
jgi:hypothetical protein